MPKTDTSSVANLRRPTPGLRLCEGPGRRSQVAHLRQSSHEITAEDAESAERGRSCRCERTQTRFIKFFFCSAPIRENPRQFFPSVSAIRSVNAIGDPVDAGMRHSLTVAFRGRGHHARAARRRDVKGTRPASRRAAAGGVGMSWPATPMAKSEESWSNQVPPKTMLAKFPSRPENPASDQEPL